LGKVFGKGAGVKGGAGRGARGIILRYLLTGGFEFAVCGVVNLIDIDREMHR
jgi:hypothetical protein